MPLARKPTTTDPSRLWLHALVGVKRQRSASSAPAGVIRKHQSSVSSWKMPKLW